MAAYLALGDSYTVGEGVAPADRWPALLAAALGLGEPRIVATTGWTTDELAAGMDVAGLAPPWALVTLLIGVNDQYRGRPAEAYAPAFQSLLERALALAPGRLVVVSIPDWGVTPCARQDSRSAHAIAQTLDDYNVAARRQSDQRGVPFADVTGISRAHPDLVVQDGLHPSAAQYALWMEAILPAARRVLAG